MVSTDVSVLEALGYSVMGLCIVFVALIAIIVVIKVLAFVVGKIEKPAEEPAETPVAPAETAPAATAPGAAGEVKLYNVSDRDAAMIMAIVADELKKPLNELRFISIREVE